MPELSRNRDREDEDALEYRAGCLLCERGDPELEFELQAWAQLLYDHFSSKTKNAGSQRTVGNIDSSPQCLTLKKTSKTQPSQIQ
jgi:hypothetical protein